jgi:hypothetical protein
MQVQHFITKYNKFINAIQSLGNRNLDYCESHHIIPRCMGGTDDPSNLVDMSFREHFLAHWMLYMAYPKNYKLANAFFFMCNIIQGTPARRREMRLQYGITSRAFAAVKTRLSDLGNVHNVGVVSCIDTSTNQKVRITSFEYALYPDRYQFHTNGKTYCYNMITHEYEYINKEVFRSNKDTYMAIVQKNMSTYMYNMYDPITNKITKISYSEVQSINANRSNNDKLLRVINHKLSVVDDDGVVSVVTLDEYRKGGHTHKNAGSVKVFDTTDQTFKSISKETYHQNPQQYNTSTKGKVLAYDTVEMKNVLIDKKSFDKTRYVGQTKNLTSVYDKVDQKWVQITREQAKDKSRYQGPCTGKINVIDITTGQRSQISKDKFDSAIHINLGDKRYYFKALWVPRNKMKNIHIYEWRILDHTLYEIQDLDLFNQLAQTYLK